MSAVQYLPEGWTAEEMAQAKADLPTLINSKLWCWLGNYIGCRQRSAKEDCAPSNPGLHPHGKYIEGAARLDECEQFLNAVRYLTAWRPPEDGKEKGGD